MQNNCEHQPNLGMKLTNISAISLRPGRKLHRKDRRPKAAGKSNPIVYSSKPTAAATGKPGQLRSKMWLNVMR